jgi:hypothetical protein
VGSVVLVSISSFLIAYKISRKASIAAIVALNPGDGTFCLYGEEKYIPEPNTCKVIGSSSKSKLRNRKEDDSSEEEPTQLGPGTIYHADVYVTRYL